MENKYRPIRAIVSGGGTGGHIFPAISIANKLKEVQPETEILFVGAEGKMEMEKVPAAGYKIVGLPIVGMQRKLTLQNIINDIQVPFKVLRSIGMARRILKEFKPDVVIGVGGYASAPLLWAATGMKIPALIQEQNGFAGVTNKLLGKRVQSICVAYEGMERFFPADRIVLSGNPIRKEVSLPPTPEMREEAIKHFGLDPERKHLFIVGGSLGSGTLNKSMKQWILKGCLGGSDIDIIWQCGKYYKAGIDEFMKAKRENEGLHLDNIGHYDFISRMDLAYAAADLVISRSGASSVSELCAMGKAVVFVPSPNVAEDHQTHNAMALVRKDAAVLVKDADAVDTLLPTAIGLLHDDARREAMSRNALGMALREAAQTICDEVYRIL
ncbi:MAG: undecaprenyldiphospho-muramoylpentapeptide beta-N-acetylglucosaminyltransferase [Bacteroidales bacterium]|nr:undecaprenyldiphospho-muramoylpentapeptide beta-N-acetylglucosaminyltransferase [Bacteroidales bacterium]